ncbi:hypothetical protein AB0K74_49065, partial [Streptomyces sp. NPDC056159]
MLLAAPAAFATESPTPTAAETTDNPGGSTGDDGQTTETVDPSKSADDTTTTEDPSKSADDTTTTGDDNKSDDTGKKSANTGSDSKDEGTTDKESATPSASPSETPGPQACNDTEDLKQDKNLRTSLSGLPSKITAGSGFHNFKLNVKNSGNNTYKRVDMGVFAALIDDKKYTDESRFLTLQYQDPTTGTWQNISVDVNDETSGYLGYTDVQAKESFSIDLRLSVDKKAP